MANFGMHTDPVIDGCELRFRSGTPPYGVDHHGIRATINGSVHPPASRLVPRINGLAVRWGNLRRRWRKMLQFEYDYAARWRQALISGVVRPFHCSKFQVFRVLPGGRSSRRDQSTARAPPGPACGPLWRASSAPASTRRSSSRTCRKPAERGEEPAGSRSTVAVRRQGSDDGHNDVLVIEGNLHDDRLERRSPLTRVL